MSVNSYLESLASQLVLSTSEKDHISNSISTIKSRLDTYFGSNITEKKLFGSYVRGTILPRKADSGSDIDLMVVFKNEDCYKPQSFLNRLKNFAEHYYSTSEIYQSSPTVVLELNHIKFELNSERCDVELICDNSVMDAIIDKFGTEAKTYAYDMTSFKLEVNVAVNHVFLSWVFGFSGKVKIKGPENVLEEYKDMVQKVFASLQ